MEQAVSLEKAFQNSRCSDVVSFPLRVSPLCVLAREHIVEGTVGTPEHILGVNYVPYGTVYFDDLYRNYDMTQGLFLQKATHDFDYLMFLMGEPHRARGSHADRAGASSAARSRPACAARPAPSRRPVSKARRIAGATSRAAPTRTTGATFGEDCGTPETGMNEDSSSAVLEFASGAHGATPRSSTAAAKLGHPRRHRQRLPRAPSASTGIRTRCTSCATTSRSPTGPRATPGRATSAAMPSWAATSSTWSRRARSHAPASEGLQSIYACLAAKESADKGCFMDVKQVEGNLP